MSDWKRSRWASFMAFGCVHAPCHDMEAVNWAMGRARDVNPDFLVCLGDMLEGSAASRWANEDPWDIMAEFKAANAILMGMREAAPNAKLIFMEGNHEHNIRAENRIPKALRGVCDYRLHIPALKEWEFHEYRNDPSCCRAVGQVVFGHGWATSGAAIHREAFRMAPPNGLYVSAHTHRPLAPQLARQGASLTLDRSLANVGCLRDMAPEYMRREDNSRWGQGIVYGEARTGRALREKRYWTAKTEVFRMATGEPAPGMECACAGSA